MIYCKKLLLSHKINIYLFINFNCMNKHNTFLKNPLIAYKMYKNYNCI